jgi:Rod binding domain-containing protein
MHLAKAAVQEMASQNMPAPQNPKLERSAHEFEASLMAELLKPMQEADSLNGEENDAGEGGALQGFASESLARAISERGGFGIADRILRQLNPASATQSHQDQNGAALVNLKASHSPPI